MGARAAYLSRLKVAKRSRGKGRPEELRSWCLQLAAGMEEGINVARFPSKESWDLVIPGLGFQRLLPVTLQWWYLGYRYWKAGG